MTPIDFSNIDLSTRTFNVDIVTPEGFVNVSNYQSATITVNLEGYSEKWVSVGNITPVNVADGIEATVLNQSLEVLVVGPANDVARITDQDIYAQVNMSNRQEIGTAEDVYKRQEEDRARRVRIVCDRRAEPPHTGAIAIIGNTRIVIGKTVCAVFRFLCREEKYLVPA